MTNKFPIYRIYFNTEENITAGEINSFLLGALGYSDNCCLVEKLDNFSHNEYVLDLRIPLRTFEEQNLILYLKQQKDVYYFADCENHYMDV